MKPLERYCFRLEHFIAWMAYGQGLLEYQRWNPKLWCRCKKSKDSLSIQDPCEYEVRKTKSGLTSYAAVWLFTQEEEKK